MDLRARIAVAAFVVVMVLLFVEIPQLFSLIFGLAFLGAFMWLGFQHIKLMREIVKRLPPTREPRDEQETHL